MRFPTNNTIPLLLLLLWPALSAAKIVLLNGTEVFGGGVPEVPVRWFSQPPPRNISNHSGGEIRKSDDEEEEAVEEEEMREEDEKRQESPLATRDPAVLSSLRGIWSDLSPILTVLSTILGIFLMFVIVESPLSPLPVPPLPYSPVGPYPPSNMYSFSMPPHRSQYDVGYSGPKAQASYRIPRHMGLNETLEEALQFLEKQMAKPTGGSQHILATIRTMWQPALQKCVQLLADRLSQITSDSGFRAYKREMMKQPDERS